MTISEKLNQLLERDQEKIERWFRQNLQASRRYKKAFVRQWLGSLSEFRLSEDGRFILPTMPNVQKLDGMVRNIRYEMELAGLQDYTDELIKSMDKRIRTANTLWNQLKFEPAKIEQIRDMPVVLEHIQNVRNSVIRGSVAQEQELYGKLLEYNYSMTERSEPVDFSELKETLISKAGILPKYAGTIANTELFAMNRTIRKEQGQKAGLEYAKYYGALDSVTRPFCRANVGRIETWEYWRSIRNDTNPQPPAIYGGGYNCRHSLIPMNPEWDSIEWN